MAQNIPSAEALSALFVQIYETLVGQDAPVNDKADIRIRAKVWTMIAMIVFREVVDSAKQNFALTASRDQLINIFGVEYDLPIKSEESTVLTVTLPATTGTTIDAGTDFTSDDTGIIYFNSVPVVAVADVATLSVTARTPGVIGNLANGLTLSIARDFPGAEKTATITATTTTGANAEETEVYRQRVLDIIRAPGGGANSADFRNWGQLEEGVNRTYPYAGRPVGDPLFPGAPPHRTVYVEADDDIDPDGIAPPSLLTSTKLTIITDDNDGRHRQPLGLTNDTLHVESIIRSPFYPTITGLVTISGTEAQVKDDIDTAVDNYFLSLNPFVTGLDVDSDRNDLITAPAMGKPIQSVLDANGASMEKVEFTDIPATAFLPSYLLQMGEKAKNGGISYV